MAGNQKVATENINEVILRLLKINSGLELDYQTYYEIIKKKLASARLVGKELPGEEDELLRNEFKRVKNKKGRFKVKTSKAKVSVSPPPSAPPSPSSGGGNRPRGGKIAKSPSGKITANNSFFQQYIDPVKVRDITEKSAKISRTSSDNSESLKTSLDNINKTLDSIVNTLTDINDRNRNQLEEKRKEEENKKRKSREGELESKTFDGIKKAISAITKPFQSIWDKILNFIGNIILGRILIKLVNWIADPKNQGKIKSIIRFFKDWWPALLGSYVLFGTTFGKFVRGTVGMLGRFIFQIGKVAIPQLLKFIRTPLGKGIALFTAGATIPAMFPQTVNEQERKTEKAPGIKEDKIKQLQTQKANLNVFERLQGKGSEIDEQIYFLQTGKTKQYGFSGGGFSGGLGSGLINGPKGRDRVPAMLTDGEFVMSVGAVNKYGVETLEAMNAAGGGTNQPQVVGGKTYAYGGGEIDKNKNQPFSKNPIDAVERFLRYKFGVNLNNKSTWGPSQNNFNTNAPTSNTSFNSASTGSLLTNPLGAISRIASRSGLPSLGMKGPSVSPSPSRPSSVPPSNTKGSLFTDPLGAISRIASRSGLPSLSSLGRQNTRSQSPNKATPKSPTSTNKKDEKISDYFKSSTYRDAGAIYAKQMLGGLGGSISEADLSKESKSELQKAIQRAKKRTGQEIRKAEMKIADLEASGASKTPKGREALATQRSFLKKLKDGGIRVQYTDYNDEKGNLTPAAKGAKTILGQFWANERSKEEGGGYRIEDNYDFDRLKIKDSKTNKMRDMTNAELFSQGVLGKGKSFQERLQAAHLLNPFKGKGDVDMVLGGKRTTSEKMGLIAGKTPIGSMLGITGKPKTPNQKALEKKRPWWDKMGWFGGASKQMQENKNKEEEFKKKNKSVNLYDKPQKNTKQSNKSRFTRPKTATKTPVKPIPKPAAKKKTSQYKGGQRSSNRNKSKSGTKPPSFSPNHSAKSTKTARSTLGVKK
jgi:hypothetical protein